MVEHHPSSPKDQAKIHQFGKKVSPAIFLGFELIVREFGKGNILIADLEDLENMDASNIYLRRIIAKEYHCCENNYRFDALQTNCFGINIKL